MTIAIATFVLCAAIIVGAYWAFILRPEDVASRALRKRLTTEPRDRQTRTDLMKKTRPLSALKALDGVLLRSGGVIRPLQRTIALAALPITVGMVVLGCALVGMVTFTVTFIVTAQAWLALILGALLAPLPYG